MNLQDFPKATGHLLIEVFDSTGKLRDSRFIPNLVVTVGKNYIASRMIDTSQAVMGWMELGTSTTSPSAGDTTLVAAIGGSRQAFNTAAVRTANAVTYSANFAAGVGTGALTEAGIFNASSAGTMLCRTVFPVVNKAAGDVVNISWTVTIS